MTEYPLGDPKQAERLWPNSEVLQRKWREAVALVRSTCRGWVLDLPKKRGN